MRDIVKTIGAEEVRTKDWTDKTGWSETTCFIHGVAGLIDCDGI